MILNTRQKWLAMAFLLSVANIDALATPVYRVQDITNREWGSAGYGISASGMVMMSSHPELALEKRIP